MDRSFLLTVEHASGLPLRGGCPPSTYVRCRQQGAQQLLFMTQVHQSNHNPQFSHQETISAKSRVLIFELLDDQGVLGGFKIDSQVICEGLLKTRDQRMRIDYPLGADRSASLTLSFHIVPLDGSAVNYEPAPQFQPAPIASNPPVVGSPSHVTPPYAASSPQPIHAASPTATMPRPFQHIRTSSIGEGMSPFRGATRPSSVGSTGFITPPPGGLAGAPIVPPPSGTTEIKPPSAFVATGGDGMIKPPSYFAERRDSLGPDAVLSPAEVAKLQENYKRALIQIGVLQNELKQTQEALAQAIATLQANGLTAGAQSAYQPAQVPVYQPPPSAVNTYTPPPGTATPLSNSQGSGQAQTPPDRRSSDGTLSAQNIVATIKAADRCEICQQLQEGSNRINLCNHLFCRKCALDMRQNLGAKNANNAEFVTKYIQEKGLPPPDGYVPSTKPQQPVPVAEVYPEQPCAETSELGNPGADDTLDGSYSVSPNHSSPRVISGPNPNPLTNSGSFRLFTLENSIATTNPHTQHFPTTRPMQRSNSMASLPRKEIAAQYGAGSQPIAMNPGAMNPTATLLNPYPQPSSGSPSGGSPTASYNPHLEEGAQPEEISDEEEEEKEQIVDFYMPEDSTNIIMSDNEVNQIKAATFTMLIAKLTQMPSLIDIDDFLLTYRSFCPPAQFLDALLKRFSCVRPDDARAIHLRVFNILGKWISNFWFDFETDETCYQVVTEFLEKVTSDASAENANNVKVANGIKSKLQKKKSEQGQARKIFTGEAPASIPEKDPNQPLILADSLEIARQITLRHWETWYAIKPWEFLGLAWQKHGKEEKAAHILKMTSQFNHFSAWVSSSIISTPRLADRAKLVKKFMDIANHLRSLGNFNGLMEIWSGLQRQPVFRMQQTFAEVFRDRKYHTLWGEYSDLLNHDGAYHNLRNAIQVTNPPVIPYLGMYLSDLVFMEEGNPKKIGELINYFKCRSISTAIKKIQQYQQKAPALQKVVSIFMKLECLQIIESEAEMYNISMYHEPKEGREPGPRPASLDVYLKQTQSPIKAQSIPGGLKKKTASFSGPAKRRSDGNLSMAGIATNNPRDGSAPPNFGIMRTNSANLTPITRREITPASKRASRTPTDDEKEKADALCSASWSGDLNQVKNLLGMAGANYFINLPNSRGQPALYCAARQGHAAIVVELLNSDGIDIHATNLEHGSTPLHAASFADHPEIVCLLLWAGADHVARTNKQGLPARAEARGNALDVYANFEQIISVSAGDEFAFGGGVANGINALNTLKGLYPSVLSLKNPVI